MMVLTLPERYRHVDIVCVGPQLAEFFLI